MMTRQEKIRRLRRDVYLTSRAKAVAQFMAQGCGPEDIMSYLRIGEDQLRLSIEMIGLRAMDLWGDR